MIYYSFYVYRVSTLVSIHSTVSLFTQLFPNTFSITMHSITVVMITSLPPTTFRAPIVLFIVTAMLLTVTHIVLLTPAILGYTTAFAARKTCNTRTTPKLLDIIYNCKISFLT